MVKLQWIIPFAHPLVCVPQTIFFQFVSVVCVPQTTNISYDLYLKDHHIVTNLFPIFFCLSGFGLWDTDRGERYIPFAPPDLRGLCPTDH